jgi:hypothetical protein
MSTNNVQQKENDTPKESTTPRQKARKLASSAKKLVKSFVGNASPEQVTSLLR